MIIRIVKMTFAPEHADTFEAFSRTIYNTIRSTEGCQHLEIYRDIDQPHIFFSYSHWEKPENLENYRKSDYFRQTWATTKQWFAARAEAWSVARV